MIQVECPICDATGKINENQCEHCVNGLLNLSECPRTYIGGDLTRAINMAGMCGNGDWPVSGGLLKQSAWFLSLKQHCDNERTRLEKELSDGSN